MIIIHQRKKKIRLNNWNYIYNMREKHNKEIKQMVVMLESLHLLIEIINNKCKCGEKLQISSEKMKGHVVILTLSCYKCNFSTKWQSSAKYPDGSFVINKDVVRAWLSTGGESYEKYSTFTKEWGIGKLCKSSYFQSQSQIANLVSDLSDNKKNILIEQEKT